MRCSISHKTILAALAIIVLTTGMVAAQDDGKININTASVQELTALERVGQAYAERIVAYREAHGPFKSPSEIINVQGIGEKILELNKDRIKVK
jgi:competence protein ComEA